MFLKINVVIFLFFLQFFFYNFNIEVIDVNNCIFIKIFNKYRVLNFFYKILRFLLQNTNKVYAL